MGNHGAINNLKNNRLSKMKYFAAAAVMAVFA